MVCQKNLVTTRIAACTDSGGQENKARTLAFLQFRVTQETEVTPNKGVNEGAICCRKDLEQVFWLGFEIYLTYCKYFRATQFDFFHEISNHMLSQI